MSEQTGCSAVAGAPSFTSRGDATSRTRHSPIDLRADEFGSTSEALARGRRHVVRYDLRDCGVSTTVNPTAPAYRLRDLAADAASLVRKLDDRPAHLAGIGVGGMVTQVAALDHPAMFSALTLVGTRPVAPGPVDEDLPEHDATMMDRLFSRPMPDWSDGRPSRSTPPPARRSSATTPPPHTRVPSASGDRTPGTEPAVQMANQMGMVFSKLNCTPRWRERLPELAIPVLVVHGRQDPFFPVGNGEVLTREHAVPWPHQFGSRAANVALASRAIARRRLSRVM
jgi:pimeloyl-ACP methyl ester carboxylesterase